MCLLQVSLPYTMDKVCIVTSTLYLMSILQGESFYILLSSSTAHLTKYGFRFTRQTANLKCLASLLDRCILVL